MKSRDFHQADKVLLLIGLLLFQLCAYTVKAQSQKGTLTPQKTEAFSDPVESFLDRGLRYNFSKEGDSYVKFGLASQFWLRQIWNNPGSLDIRGNSSAQSFDVALRRMRFSLTAHFDQRFTLYTQFGVNNQTFVSGGANTASGISNKKPGMFIHDFWVKFHLLPRQLELGIGLHAYNGISRLSNVSYKYNFMLDNPTFNFPNIEHTDQIGRQLGLFATGQLSRLHYRISYAKPFVYQDQQRDDPPVGRAIEVENENMAMKAYAAWQFWEKEYNLLPFTHMTYLGTKRLLNVGMGFDYHPKSTLSLDPLDGAERLHDRLSLGADVFMELPLKNTSAINLYLVGYHYDYGPYFLRSSGVMNISQGGALHGEPLPQGGGNQQFILGTGNIAYASMSYLLGKRLFEHGGRLQPFYAYTYKDFEGLGTSSHQHDAGINYLMYGHHVKFSLQYSSRPIYQGSIGPGATGSIIENKGMLIFQTQIVL